MTDTVFKQYVPGAFSYITEHLRLHAALTPLEMRRSPKWTAIAAVSMVLLFSGQAFSGEMDCGGVHLRLSCTATGESSDAGSCVRSSLEFLPSHGGRAKPKTISSASSDRQHSNKIPVEASCLTNSDLESFVLVQFSAGPRDCIPCSVMELFTPEGARITTLGRHLDREMGKRRLLFPSRERRSLSLKS